MRNRPARMSSMSAEWYSWVGGRRWARAEIASSACRTTCWPAPSGIQHSITRPSGCVLATVIDARPPATPVTGDRQRWATAPTM